MDDLSLLVKNLLSQNLSPEQIKAQLLAKGFLEEDIDRCVDFSIGYVSSEKVVSERKFMRMIAFKEILDKVGYGFVSHPFINILFSFTGASYFLIALINGLRTAISLFYSSFMKGFSKVHTLGKKFIGSAGIIYGFSFLIMAFAVVLHQKFFSPLLYSLAFILGSLGVVAHGELYVTFIRNNLKRERMGHFLTRISSYGVLITTVSLLISGFVMDFFPVYGRRLSFVFLGFPFSFNLYGYLLSFEITAFAFIISGYILSNIKSEKELVKYSAFKFFCEFLSKFRVHLGFFLNNRAVLLLTLTSVVTGLVQVLGNSFYGIFIYEHFKGDFFGGFMNVALVFSIAILASFIGPFFTRNLHRYIGISPMLVFGTLLTAMLPLSMAFNPVFIVVVVASALSIIGSSILGMAQGFFTRKLLSEADRQIFFSYIGVAVSLPILLLSPLGGWVASVFGLVALLKLLLVLLIFIAAPLYLFMVVIFEKKPEVAF